jgi:hypothetical protein
MQGAYWGFVLCKVGVLVFCILDCCFEENFVEAANLYGDVLLEFCVAIGRRCMERTSW